MVLFEKIISGIPYQSVNWFEINPDQDRHSVCPDLGPNCLQTLSPDDNSRQRINREVNQLIAQVIE